VTHLGSQFGYSFSFGIRHSDFVVGERNNLR
jgi:hypothetical protein